MDKNRQDKTESELIATENKSQLSPFSPEDEKEAQKELVRLRKRLHENENGAINLTRKLNHKRTGFEDKTLWDWLQLLSVLAIPLVVVAATIGFGWWQVHLADLQHESDQRLAQQQHDADQRQLLDQQQATILQTYIDDIQDLLLNHHLLNAKPGDDVTTLAQARTITALQGLDPIRKGLLLNFLYEDRLIGYITFDTKLNKTIYHSPILLLYGANFSGAYLSGFDFSGAYLAAANFSGANLHGNLLNYASFGLANLSGANLSNASLYHAIFIGSNLVSTQLKYAQLTDADLYTADLRHADLSWSVLVGTNFSDALLSGADLLNADFRGLNSTDRTKSYPTTTRSSLYL